MDMFEQKFEELKGQEGVLEGRSPSHITNSPSPSKERGTQGVRMI